MALKALVARGLVRAGRRPSAALAALDARQPVGPADFSDSFYFTAASRSPDAPLAFYARLGFRPTCTETWFGLWTPELGLLELERDEGLATSGLSASGLEFDCLKPGESWRVAFDGPLRSPDGAIHSARLEARFDAVGPLYDFEDGTPPSLVARSLSMEPWSRRFFEELRGLHQAHLEQLGRCEVALTLGGRERRVTLHGGAISGPTHGCRRASTTAPPST